MIRPATEADIPGLVELGRFMHEESDEYRGIRYEDDRVASTLKQMILKSFLISRVFSISLYVMLLPII